MFRSRKENLQLSSDYNKLQESYKELEALKEKLENKELTWMLNLTDAQKDAEQAKMEVRNRGAALPAGSNGGQVQTKQSHAPSNAMLEMPSMHVNHCFVGSVCHWVSISRCECSDWMEVCGDQHFPQTWLTGTFILGMEYFVLESL